METELEVHHRRRRTSSVTRATDILKIEQKLRKKQPDRPVHSPKDSLFNSSSGYTNYRGLLNLCFIILVLSNARVALENVIKYGILVDPTQWVMFLYNSASIGPICTLLLNLNIFLLSSFCLERFLASRRIIGNQTVAICSGTIVLFMLSLPPIVFRIYSCNPVGASICCVLYSIVSLKLISYHMVNCWCRRNDTTQHTHVRHKSLSFNGSCSDISHSHQQPSSSECDKKLVSNITLISYPNNLTLGDLYYFMFAPTLCYELNFPRSERIRKGFLMKRIFEIMFLLQLDLGLIQQWMVPTIRNSLEPLKEMSFSRMLERLLKLAVPNHLIWLIFFYWFFHSYLNLLAELMRFADREFYCDWWNSQSVNYFWQNWNIPVHRWCVRHVYVPLLSLEKIHFTRFWASTLVFFISAFFHEYLVSVPLNMYRIWAFTGMIMQLPFSYLVSKYLNHQAANIAVWISLILGQPLCILMYYHDYYVMHIAKSI